MTETHEQEALVRAAVLGPAMVDGVAVTGTQRSIVAALVLHRSGGVPTELLIDAVWGEHVPPSARSALQNQISRLRRRFGGDLIETDAAGYHLRRTCDVDDFEGLVAPWMGRPATPVAIRALEAGLALWRGEPYTDLTDHVGAEVERSRLGELHAHAAERLAVCRIAAGDLGQAVAELAALSEVAPYREHRWCLLVLALHLDGRRTEALAAYERAEARLQRDLGTRPSSALQRLHPIVERDESVDLSWFVDVLTDRSAEPLESGRCRRDRRARCSSRPIS